MLKFLLAAVVIFSGSANANTEFGCATNIGPLALEKRMRYIRLLSEKQNFDVLCDFRNSEKTAAFRSTDPNFPKVPISKFKGVSVARIIKDLGVKSRYLTILTSDEFTFFDTVDNIVLNGGLIAFEAGGTAIPGRLGGPHKLVYKKRRNVSAYPWYIRTIIFSDELPRELKIAAGKKVVRISPRDLSKLAPTKNIPYPPARGFFNSLSLSRGAAYSAVHLLAALGSKSLQWDSLLLEGLNGFTLKVAKKDAGDLYIGFTTPEDGIPSVYGGRFQILKKVNENYIPQVYFLESLHVEK